MIVFRNRINAGNLGSDHGNVDGEGGPVRQTHSNDDRIAYLHTAWRTVPGYILVSDFQSLELHDFDQREAVALRFADLAAHVEAFCFIVGVHRRTFRDQDPANNIKAAGACRAAARCAGGRGVPGLPEVLAGTVHRAWDRKTGAVQPEVDHWPAIVIAMDDLRALASGALLKVRVVALDSPLRARAKRITARLGRRRRRPERATAGATLPRTVGRAALPARVGRPIFVLPLRDDTRSRSSTLDGD